MIYTPITKEKAAEILSVSKRTIDNMMATGTIPRPAYIGRRAYWHPEVFYQWLNTQLGKSHTESQAPYPTTRIGRPRKSGR